MADVTPPDHPSWWTVLVAVFGTGAITVFWRPVGAWVERRLAMSDQEHAVELSSCRQEIKALRTEFEKYRRESEEMIRRLTAQVAALTERVAARDETIKQLQERRA